MVAFSCLTTTGSGQKPRRTKKVAKRPVASSTIRPLSTLRYVSRTMLKFDLGQQSTSCLQAIRKELFTEQGEQRLLKDRHLVYLRSGLKGLNKHFTALDARCEPLYSAGVLPAFHGILVFSRPWLAYWTIHSLDLLGEPPIESYSRAVGESG